MQPEPLISRGELEGMLFAITDINVNIEKIRELLEEELGGEEALPEDDA